MLRRGVLEGPFTSKPDPGPLPTLPAYMVRLPYHVQSACGALSHAMIGMKITSF